MSRRSQTGGQAVVDALVAGGVRHAFTVPGESFLGVLDALHDAPIRTIATRHEGGAAFMAEAVGQLTGRPAACLATRAVGAANLAIGLHTARADSTPLIALVGQVPTAFRGREAFQEVDQVETFGRLCKAAAQVDDPARMGAETARLLAIAREGRPGPVLLALPEDALDETVEPAAGPAGGPSSSEPGRPAPALAAVRAILIELTAASTPVIVAGAGLLRSGAVAELQALAERAVLPVVTAWRRPDVFDNEHPFYLGMSGLGAAASVRQRLLAADVILALGTRLNELASYDYTVPAPGTRLLQVDIEPGFPGDRRQPDLAVRADARRFLAAALACLEDDPDGVLPRDREARHRAIAADRASYLAASTPPERVPGTPVDPATVVRAVNALLPDDAVITSDAGNFAGWYTRYLRMRHGQRFLGPTSGAMGYALPAAIGAAAAEPGRPVVALAGDGGLAMLMAELETAVREHLSLVVLVHDNGRFGTIRSYQERQHPGRVVATELGPIDFAAVAEACGAAAIRVARDADVADAVAAAVAAAGVTVVHLTIDRRRLSVDLTLESD
ncbi:MAG: thiamine pyrophosphate-dependent enzyme [Candidatus Limnocylindrales bacterium]